MAHNNQPRILITDDQAAIRDDLSEYLSDLGYAVDTVSDAGSTLLSVADTEYNVLLLDHMLLDNTGLDILPAVLTTCPTLSVVVMTGYPTVDLIISAVRRGACDVVVKPFALKELSAAVARAMTRNQQLIERIEATTSDNATDPDGEWDNRQRVTSRSEM